ncbi:MAG: hypothetical protein AB7P31_00855 [Steroidobacteraceae bacterium]
MSLPIQELSCTGCNFEQSLVADLPYIRYALNDSRFAHGSSSHDWCHSCGKVCSAERLEDIEVLERAVLEAETFIRGGVLTRLRKRLFGSMSALRVRAVTILVKRRNDLEWRRQRVAPAHCFECGGTRLSQIPWSSLRPRTVDGHPIPVDIGLQHVCGGHLQFFWNDEIRVNVRPSTKVLHPEGRFLWEESTEPDWRDNVL